MAIKSRDNMFSVPILHVKCKFWEHKKVELLNLATNSKKSAEEYGISTDYFDKKDSNSFAKNKSLVKHIFIEEFDEFKEHFNFSEIYLDSFWFQTSTNGQHHQVHNHGPVGYTAICYIEYDQNIHKPTVFVSPFFNFIDGSTLYYEPTDVESGSIIFFPSSILHYAPSNYSHVPRTIMSCNILVK